MIKGSPLEVYSSQRAQICSATIKTVTLLEAYKDFEDVFLVKNAVYLPSHKDHNHAMNLIDGK